MKNTLLLRALRAFSRGAKPTHGRISAGGIGATIERALSAAGLSQRSDASRADRVVAHLLPREPQAEPENRSPSSAPTPHPHSGEFLSRSFTARAGTRGYKLYVPSGYRADSAAQTPLVVMLHGCTQSADDFAAGTGMNALAEQQGFIVAYPEQAGDANPSRCWNWFRPGDQQRDAGEPSLIAGITREIAAAYRVDPRRIYVAGLSAGAAMAVVLAATYPELYAAVGAHSGLPYGSAHDIPSAFGAMKNGGARASARAGANAGPAAQAVPTIVFHGDNDGTVTSRNSKAIVDQVVGAHHGEAVLVPSSHDGVTAGRRYVRTVYAAGGGSHPRVEHWTIRGGGHAWSGGSSSGSYADPQGPNASAEMIRFFYTHAR